MPEPFSAIGFCTQPIPENSVNAVVERKKKKSQK
jgi:hypothetical protein